MKFLIITILFITLSIPTTNAYMVISDVHAGSQNTRKGLHGRPNDYPKKGVAKFESSLKQAVKRGEKIVLSLGDETNNRTTSYEKKLLKVARKYPQLTILYTRGNHNPNNSVLTPRPYYYVDLGDKRIVVLNTNEIDANGRGGISQTQMEWLKEAIKDKQSIVLMHHPVFLFNTCTVANQELKDVLDNPNVEKVFAGHWHLRLDCGKYQMFPALTSRGYSIIN